MEYSIAELIDRFIVVHLKIWHITEILNNETDKDRLAQAGKDLAFFIKERARLRNEINKKLGGREIDRKIWQKS